MAYVNVRDWSVDQVTDWIKGLDVTVLQYTTSFLNNGVTGHQLLCLRADDLDNLGVRILGHQEIILEAVELLRHLHYELDKENLQMLALKVSCASNSLYRELLLISDSGDQSNVVKTQTMADVHNIINLIKPLVCWLDRAPFVGDKDYIDCKTQLLELCLKMATNAHRDIFSENPVSSIREFCEKITKLSDHIIQEVSDPMVLQPASLDLATLKKKEQGLGFLILASNHATHQIGEIKYDSPAHCSSKIEEGDEIVQVNYQTVVGWQRKNVMMLIQDSLPEIVLTVKKRPRHTKVYGQIYMKPYRLPSKKRDGHPYSRWNDSIPSPRLLPIHNLPPINIPELAVVIEPCDVEIELSSSDDSEPPDSPTDGTVRIYPLKPRPILQRRNTITGSTPTSKRPYPSVEQYWQIFKDQAASKHASSYNIDNVHFETDSNFLRDKSVSCNLGLEYSPRPTTVIGLTPHRHNTGKTPSFQKEFKEKPSCKKKVNFVENDIKTTNYLSVPPSNLNEEKSCSVTSLASLNNEPIGFIDEGRELTDRTSMVTEREEIKTDCDRDNVKDKALADVKIHDIIKKFDERNVEGVVKPKIYPRSQLKKPPDVPHKPEGKKKPAVPPRSATTKLRGRLDKSHSTPAYDLTEDESSPVDKFPVESTEVLLTEETILNVPENKIEADPFLESKYELGIPIIDTVNLHLIQETIFPPEPEEIINDVFPTSKPNNNFHKEVPPKPPPRTFGIVDSNKPAYPVDSPKPIIEEYGKCETTILSSTKTTMFEFPENNKQIVYSVEAIAITSTKPSEQAKIPTNNETKAPIKHFESKTASTPKSKNDFSGDDGGSGFIKPSPSFELQKSETKISPTNSIVRAMIYSNKNKGSKKKNSLCAKRRKVTVNDLNPADIQGFLYQRLRKHNQSVHWEKRWFVLSGNCLYGFKTKEDPRASCLIFLSGFTVAVASEVKSRSNAFKVYHTGTAFYFSAEDTESLQTWIELITAATLNNDTLKNTDQALHSETDESDTEKPKKQEPEKNPENLRKFGSLKKFTSKKTETGANGSTSLDRKWFFNKPSNHPKNSLPVPTAQFRSYRKIKNDDGGGSITTGNFTSHVAFFAPRSDIPKLQQSMQNVSVPNLTTVEQLVKNEHDGKAARKLSKLEPINYIHASNPSLCNINDFHIGNPFTQKNSFKQCENLAGFVTLEELMIKQTEERRSNPYNIDEDFSINLNLIKPDVVYGEVPIRSKEKPEQSEKHEGTLKKGHPRNAPELPEEKESTSSCFGRRLGSLKKSQQKLDPIDPEDCDPQISTFPKIGRGFDQKLNRSLPRTHKLSDKTNSRYASDRNLNFKERSYEMIYCPQTTSDIQFAKNRNLDDQMSKIHKIKKQASFSDKKGQETPKHAYKISDAKIKLKSANQYTPMSLPLGSDQKSKPKLAFELNLDEKAARSGKFKHMFAKQTEAKKEKTFLGSPKLHRNLFRKNTPSQADLTWPADYSQPASITQSTISLDRSPPLEVTSVSVNMSPHADYPGLEYPPVFEPETYSLADPQSSLTLLRKQGKNTP